MLGTGFPTSAAEQLMHYVYRLIDPRNGETFYVGKGQGDRVFAHAQAMPAEGENDDNLVSAPKYQRIRDIQGAGLEVIHVIHRLGMTQKTAFEVEAALIDAYPCLVNLQAGHGANDRGSRHADEIIKAHTLEPFELDEPLILINIAALWNVLDTYQATRGVWRLDPNRVKRYRLVLGHARGIVRGAYHPDEWLPATTANFTNLEHDIVGRWGFKGRESEMSVWDKYVGKRVPNRYRRKGQANPIRYCDLPAARRRRG